MKIGGRNGGEMFGKIEETISEFMESNEGVKISYQLYNKDQNSALILEIVTQHAKVINKSIFHKNLNKI